jgi:hypothetical protein
MENNHKDRNALDDLNALKADFRRECMEVIHCLSQAASNSNASPHREGFEYSASRQVTEMRQAMDYLSQVAGNFEGFYMARFREKRPELVRD